MSAPFSPFAAISPISPVATGAVAGMGGISAPGVSGPGASTGVSGAPSIGMDFASALNSVASMEGQANAAAVRIATGGSQDIAGYMNLASRAQLAVEMTAAVRNRAVDAFGEIMRMQV